jgi:putative endonuclease
LERRYHTYIMASRTGTIYVGVSGDIETRVRQHKEGKIEGFSKKYKCDRLVYYEVYGQASLAIGREKQLKGWRRSKKIALIEKLNPRWTDLAESWGAEMRFRGQSLGGTP